MHTRVEGIGPAHCHTLYARSRAPDPDGWSAGPGAAQPEDGVRRLIILSRIGQLLAAQQTRDDLRRLFEAAHRVVGRITEGPPAQIPIRIAGAQPQQEASAADLV